MFSALGVDIWFGGFLLDMTLALTGLGGFRLLAV